ncbi:type IV pilin protein [Neptuniibacter halophilus]|uniref:type IV pilin protein n=1 Tax=Neptuniibacter halophilus TaxID=651666 RepID=UPI002572F58E|nr:type IV pilin protein [Neptuniibacter halophilus]
MASSVSFQKRHHGFTLIELMIVVAVVGIIAAVAYPSYVDYVQKSRRADAMASLADLRIAQEKWRANNPSYTSTLADLGFTNNSREGFYTLATVGAANGFTATAAPAGVQVGDACGTFGIDENGPDYSGGNADADCWER